MGRFKIILHKAPQSFNKNDTKLPKMIKLIFLFGIFAVVYSQKSSSNSGSSSNSESYDVTVIPSDIPYGFMYSPYWDPISFSLFFVDFIPPQNKSIHRFDYKTQQFFGASIRNRSFAAYIVPVKGKKINMLLVLDMQLKLSNGMVFLRKPMLFVRLTLSIQHKQI